MIASRALSSILACTALVACASATPAPGSAAPSVAAAASPGPTGTVAAVPAKAPTPPAPPTAADIVTQGRGSFDACYARARVQRPALGRTSVDLTFTVDDDGRVLSVDLDYKHRFDEGSKDCMRKAAEAVVFPAAMHGKQSATLSFTPPP